jgi:DNA-binding MarR family transcriptional regulator
MNSRSTGVGERKISRGMKGTRLGCRCVMPFGQDWAWGQENGCQVPCARNYVIFGNTETERWQRSKNSAHGAHRQKCTEVTTMESAPPLEHENAPRPFRIPKGRIRDRFGIVVDPGFQALPDVLLINQSDLEISSEELNVLLNVMAHWHEPERMPFPRPATIARRMGVSERTVQRLLRQLRKRGFVEKVKGQNKYGTPAYDLRPLLDKLLPYARKRLAQFPRAQAPEAA